MLRPAADFRFDVGACKRIAQPHDRGIDILLAPAAFLGKQRGDFPVGLRLQDAQRQVFELPFELPDAQAVGERRKDVECQPRHVVTQLGIVALHDEAHRLQVIRKLDQHDTHVLRHREQHFAQAFELRRLRVRTRLAAAQALDHRHARGAIGKFGNARAEAVAYLHDRLMRGRGLHQQACGHALRIELEFAQNCGHTQRVRQRRLTTLGNRVSQTRSEPLQRALKQYDVRLRVVGAQRGDPLGAAAAVRLRHQLQMRRT